MPLVQNISSKDKALLIWKIEEDLDFFSSQVLLSLEESQEYSYIKTANRKLEWMAARFLQRQLVIDTLFKDDFGKPFLKSKKGHISLSHCKEYAAVIYSEENAVGIDIEPIHDKVLRIADKFLSKEEQKLLGSEASPDNFIAAWCVKETIYKWFGKKNLNFKEDMQIENLSFKDKTAGVNLSQKIGDSQLKIHVEKLNKVVFAYL